MSRLRSLLGRARAWQADPRNQRKIAIAVIGAGFTMLRSTLEGIHERQDELEEEMSHYARLEDVARIRRDVGRLLLPPGPSGGTGAETKVVLRVDAVEPEPTMVRTTEGTEGP